LVTHLTLSPGRLVIGRTADNDLQIRSKFISRHHAKITTDSQQSVIEDLNSTNGLYLGTQRVKQHVLRHGDVIQLGEHKLVYRSGQSRLRSSEPDPFTETGRLYEAWDDDESQVSTDDENSEVDGEVASEAAEVDSGDDRSRAQNGKAAARSSTRLNGHETANGKGFDQPQPDAVSANIESRDSSDAMPG